MNQNDIPTQSFSLAVIDHGRQGLPFFSTLHSLHVTSVAVRFSSLLREGKDGGGVICDFTTSVCEAAFSSTLSAIVPKTEPRIMNRADLLIKNIFHTLDSHRQKTK